MEKIRIDGFHGDYLKISFSEGPDIAAGSLDALGATGSFFVAEPRAALSTAGFGQTCLLYLKRLGRQVGVTPSSASSWGPTASPQLYSSCRLPGSLFYYYQNKTKKLCIVEIF